MTRTGSSLQRIGNFSNILLILLFLVSFLASNSTRSFENHFYEVRAGILRRSSYASSAQISKVIQVIRHPQYDRSTMKNDIALMRVKSPFSFNRWVRPICLPVKERTSLNNRGKLGPTAGTLCSTLGWGAIREKGPDRKKITLQKFEFLDNHKHLSKS